MTNLAFIEHRLALRLRCTVDTAGGTDGLLSWVEIEGSILDAAPDGLAKAGEIAETKLPRADSGDLGANFHDWFIAHILLREAKALVDLQPVAEQPPKQAAARNPK
jgi:hypothetical protein